MQLYQDLANRGEIILSDLNSCASKLRGLTSSRVIIDSKMDNCKLKMNDIIDTLTQENQYLQNAREKCDDVSNFAPRSLLFIDYNYYHYISLNQFLVDS